MYCRYCGQVADFTAGQCICQMKNKSSTVTTTDPVAVAMHYDLTSVLSEYIKVRDCLSDLYAVQNGCPLPKYEADWTAAMRRAEALLGIEAGEENHASEE